MQKYILVTAISSVLVLAACGESRSTRVITGAAGGAVAGQVIADEPLAGAAVGGVIGAVR